MTCSVQTRANLSPGRVTVTRAGFGLSHRFNMHRGGWGVHAPIAGPRAWDRHCHCDPAVLCVGLRLEKASTEVIPWKAHSHLAKYPATEEQTESQRGCVEFKHHLSSKCQSVNQFSQPHIATGVICVFAGWPFLRRARQFLYKLWFSCLGQTGSRCHVPKEWEKKQVLQCWLEAAFHSVRQVLTAGSAGC